MPRGVFEKTTQAVSFRYRNEEIENAEGQRKALPNSRRGSRRRERRPEHIAHFGSGTNGFIGYNSTFWPKRQGRFGQLKRDSGYSHVYLPAILTQAFSISTKFILPIGVKTPRRFTSSV